MVFSSIPFLYYFLPAVLAVYFLTPRKGKNAVLLLASLIFYGWGELRLLPLMAFTILLCYVCGLGIERSRKRKKLWLLASIVISVGLLGVFKYADFFIGSLNTVTGLKIPLLHLALPVGISFYTFQCLSYTIDVYRGSVPAQKNLINFGAYVALFPQLIAGPIVRYADIARELEHREHSWDKRGGGSAAVSGRAGEKGHPRGQFCPADPAVPSERRKRPSCFTGCTPWPSPCNIYFDFSGYSDMAIGLGRVLGFHFVENFNYPYLSGSVTEFWRRWHISLGSWFRDYVYIPMGGSRVSRWRWVLNILTVWMLTGLWHGAAWNFVLWGLLFAALLLAEKWIPVLQRLPGVLRHGYVLLAVVLSFVLFNADSLAQAGQDFAGLFGFGSLSLTSAETLYYLKSYAVLFVLGILGSTPVVKNAARRIDGTKAGVVLEAAAMLALLIVCTAYLVDGSFSPFLYFRF